MEAKYFGVQSLVDKLEESDANPWEGKVPKIKKGSYVIIKTKTRGEYKGFVANVDNDRWSISLLKTPLGNKYPRGIYAYEIETITVLGTTMSDFLKNPAVVSNIPSAKSL